MFCNVPEFYRDGPQRGKPTNFKRKIQSGIKIHALKLDALQSYKSGTFIVLQFCRHKSLNEMIAEKKVVSVQSVEFIYGASGGTPQILIDGRDIGIIEILALAANEGYVTAADFFIVFNKSKKYALVHWTDYRYDGNLKRLQEVNDRHKAFNKM